jgi:hypothetical protein
MSNKKMIVKGRAIGIMRPETVEKLARRKELEKAIKAGCLHKLFNKFFN